MPRHSALWQDILTSSIWSESDTTRIVFITMLASADEEGVVHASMSGLAHLARVALTDCIDSVRRLEEPDPDSRTPDHEGRRVSKVSGGWQILNWKKYQQPLERPRPSEKRRDYMRSYMAKRRSERCPAVPASVAFKELAEAAEGKKPDNLPTTPEAIFCADLYHRRHTTKWNPKEIRAFKDAMRRGVFTPENMGALRAYYAQEMTLGGNGNHRRDLLTFLNNIDGEIDRANARILNNTRRNTTNGTNANQGAAAASAANSGTSNAAQARKY